MTDGPTNPVNASLIERAKNMIVAPKAEWPRVEAERTTISGIYTGYVMILAAIGPICTLIGQQVFGISLFIAHYKPPIAYSITSAVLTYVLSLVSIYVIALIIDALAPSFGGTKNPLNAFKAAAYSWTAAWLCGIFGIIPMLAILAILGLYSLYVLYLGLPVLMKAPQDKAVGYTAVVVVCAIVLYFVVAIIVATLVAAFFPLGSMIGGGTVTL
jgi:hypothetical protein